MLNVSLAGVVQLTSADGLIIIDLVRDVITHIKLLTLNVFLKYLLSKYREELNL
jgi:hypothetical protein